MSTRAVTPPGMDREESQALTGLIALFAITAAWWALALWPVSAAPAWLERTRYVCFGVTEDGLPDGGGWIGLIAGPLGMFTILMFGWQRGIVRLLQRARRSRLVAATFVLLALGCTVLITGAAVRVQQARVTPAWLDDVDDVPPATYPRLDRAAPALALTSQGGDVIDLADFRGRPVIVTFAYAHCTTICPVIVQQALQAQEQLRSSGTDAVVMVVTLDPWRDPPSRLAAMAEGWGFQASNAYVLSGSVEDVESVLDAWDVQRTRSTTTGEVTHPSLLYVIDRDGRIAYASTGGVAAIVSLVERL